MQAEDILEQLDEQMGSGLQPIIDMLPEYYEVADTRMSVFRSHCYWLIFFEFVQFDARQRNFATTLWGYGNCLNQYNWGDDPTEGQGWMHAYTRQLFQSSPESPLWGGVERDGQKFESFLA
jgi:hypothetical protein